MRVAYVWGSKEVNECSMELIYCKFWAYPDSVLPLVDENFA